MAASLLACRLALAAAAVGFLVLTLPPWCAAQSSLETEDDSLDFTEHMVEKHNVVRDFISKEFDVKIGNVTWNGTLAKLAESHAEQRKQDCKLMRHSDAETGPDLYGENMYVGRAADPDADPDEEEEEEASDAVRSWSSELGYFDHEKKTCTIVEVRKWLLGTATLGSHHNCTEYTQLIWRNTTSIGCARVDCDKNRGVFITCFYYPRGNVPGESPY